MLLSISKPLLILLPLFFAQYILAVFALTRLALARMGKKYIVWNIVIMFVFFIGSFVFLGYYYGKRKKQVAELERLEAATFAETALSPEKLDSQE